MTNIEIGQGILGLEFGMDRRDVRKTLGKPDEIESFPPETEEDGATEVWHYDDLELSASFDETEEWTLTTLAVSSPDYLFEGVNLIGQSLEETMQQMEFLDIGEFLLIDVKPDENEDDDDDNDLEVATIFHGGLNLWFENGITTEIQWGPIWEEEEPEKKKKKKKEIEVPPPKKEEDDFYPTPHLIWWD